MGCRYTYKGKTYEAWEFSDMLMAMEPLEAAQFMPGVQSLPPIPMEKSWHETALRRVIRMAAEEGYDAVAWTTGEQQADRYDLSKKVDRISWVVAPMGGYRLNLIDSGGGLTAYRAADESDLAGTIGKELAEKIVTSEKGGQESGYMSGLDLKIGGEGMRGFYDKMLPAYASKFGKKFEARPRVVEIRVDADDYGGQPFGVVDESGRVLQSFPSRMMANEYVAKYSSPNDPLRVVAQESSKKGTPVHYLPITPAMKESVLVEGVALFNRPDQTKTPAFRRWFKDSKVVDANGEPLVVYHTSTFGDFSAFDKSQQRKGMSGYGFYFSDADGANIYADYGVSFQASHDFEGNEKKVNIMPVYLSMSNPLVADNIAEVLAKYGKRDPGQFGQSRKYGGMSEDAKTAIQRDGYDGVIASEYVKRLRDGSYKVVEPGAKGAIKHPVYVVFEPTQIKSAIGNNGEFDPANPNILMNRAPAPNAYETASRSLGEKDKTVWDRAKRALKRELLPGGNLPPNWFNAKLFRDFNINDMEFDISNRLGHFDAAVQRAYGKRYNLLPDDLKAAMNEALGGGTPNTAIPEPVREEIYKMRQVISGLSQEYANHLAGEISGLKADLSPEELILYEAIQKADAIEPASSKPSDKAAATRQKNKILDEAKAKAGLAGGTQAAMARAGKVASKGGLLQTILDNMDIYVHRSYRAFDNPNWPKEVSEEVKQKAYQYLLDRYADGQEVTPAMEEQAARAMKKILEEGTAYDSITAFIKESKLGAKDLGILKHRKQIAPEIRALLGEYTDPKVNFAKSVTKMSRLVYNQKFLEKILEIGMRDGFLFTENNTPLDRKVTRIAVESSEVYSPLNGLYTFAEVDQALKDALGKENMADWYRAVVRVNGMIKYGKTVGSPSTMFRNFRAGFLFATMNGHFNLAHARQSFTSIREYFTHGEGKDGYLRKLKRLGVIYDTPYAGEMMDLLADAQLEHTLYDHKPLTNVRATMKFMEKAYPYGDDFWKIIGFENEKRLLMKHMGMSEAVAEVEAAERIRNTYPTYSMVPKFVRSLRRFPLVGTFVSFPAEIIRISYHILRYLKQDMKTHPGYAVPKIIGLAAGAGMIHGLQLLTFALAGIDDDEEEALRDLSPAWQENSNFLAIGPNEQGLQRFIDVSFLDPYNFWKRPINAILRDQPADDAALDAAWEMLRPFFGEDIGAGILIDLFVNRKDSGGQIWNPEADLDTQVAGMASHLKKALPGIVSTVEGNIRAQLGQVRISGQPFRPSEELAATFGWRVSTFDPGTQIYYRAIDFTSRKREASQILSKVARDPNDVSDDEIVDAYDEALRAREDIYTDMGRLVQAAMSAGMTRGEVVKVLRTRDVTRSDITALLRGEVPPWKPKTLMDSSIEAADIVYDEETKDEFRRRRQVIREAARAP